jgi:hypothetical protein
MPLPLWGIALIFIALQVAQYLLRPRPPKQASEKFKIPRVEEGETIPVGFGVFELAPSIVWFGDQKEVKLDNNVREYYGKALGMLCHGPVDAWLELKWADKSTRLANPRTAYARGTDLTHFPVKGLYTAEFPIVRDTGTNLHAEQWLGLYKLFGGGLAQGGVAGIMHLHWGVLDDVVCELTKEAYGVDWASRFPGICYVTFGWARFPIPGAGAPLGTSWTTEVDQMLGECVETPNPGSVPDPWVGGCTTDEPEPVNAEPWFAGIIAGHLSSGIGGGGAYYYKESTVPCDPGTWYTLTMSMRARSTVPWVIALSSTTLIGVSCDPEPGDGLGGDYIYSAGHFTAGRDIRFRVRSDSTDGTMTVRIGCFGQEYGDGAVFMQMWNLRLVPDADSDPTPESYPQHTPYYDANEWLAPGEHRFFWGTNNPNPQPPTLLLQRMPVGLTNKQIGSHANPVAVCYEILTNAQWGIGADPALIDTAGWEDAAERLKEEQFGISFLMDDGRDAEDWLDDIMGLIDATYWTDIRTGLLKIKLIRNDYDPGTILSLTTDHVDNIETSQVEVPDLTAEVKVKYREFYDGEEGIKTNVQLTANLRLILGFTYLKIPGSNLQNVVLEQGATTWVEGTDYKINYGNGIVLVLGSGANVTEGDPVTADYTAFPRFIGFRDAVATAQNLATWMATGDLRSETSDYGMIPSEPFARFVAQRSLRGASRRVRTVSFDCDRKAFDLHPGAVFDLTAIRPDLDETIFRVTNVDFGTLEDRKMHVEGMEDVFSLSGLVVYDPTAGPGDDGPPTLGALLPPTGWGISDPDRIYVWLANGYPAAIRITSDSAGLTLVDDGVVESPDTYFDATGLTVSVTYYLWLKSYDPNNVYEDSEELGPYEFTVVAGTPTSRPAHVAPTGVITTTFDLVNDLTIATLTLTDPQRHLYRIEVRFLTDGEWSVWREPTVPPEVLGLGVQTTVETEEWVPLNANGTYGTVEWRVTYFTEDGDTETLMFRTSSDSQKPVNIAVGFGNGGSVIPTGIAGTAKVDFPFQILSIAMLAPKEAGDVEMDIWIRLRSDSGVPTVADTIFDSTVATMTGAQEYEDTTLTGLVERTFGQDGPVDIVFNVDSVVDITLLGVTLKVVRLD